VPIFRTDKMAVAVSVSMDQHGDMMSVSLSGS